MQYYLKDFDIILRASDPDRLPNEVLVKDGWKPYATRDQSLWDQIQPLPLSEAHRIARDNSLPTDW